MKEYGNQMNKNNLRGFSDSMKRKLALLKKAKDAFLGLHKPVDTLIGEIKELRNQFQVYQFPGERKTANRAYTFSFGNSSPKDP